MSGPFAHLRSQRAVNRLARRFRESYRRHQPLHDTDEASTPSRASAAACDVLHASGVSLSIVDGPGRVPLGASSPGAMLAEQLQYTAGVGPCLEAILTATVVTASAPRLQARWPTLASAWAEQAGVYSVVSAPLLGDGGSPLGAMNVFFAQADGPRFILPLHLTVVAGLVTEELIRDSADPRQAWSHVAPAHSRRNVWIAVGILAARSAQDADDAFARLRAHAYRREQTVDDLAAAIRDDPAVADEIAL
ncbi:MAG: ANTAR domain-containing protein [Gordonia polyisoprenivorans]|nr:ANTAR domain-containing protein [Gordonia polyisoprenivorans]